MTYLSEEILKALQFSVFAHKNQLRKYPSDAPYASHPFAVGLILSKAGYGDEVIMAGVLHDTVEDTAVTLKDLEENFGKRVADLVEGVTEKKELPQKQRKDLYLEHLRTAGDEIKAISAADLLANLSSHLLGLKKGDDTWKNFSKNPIEYIRTVSIFHRERIKIIKQNTKIPFALELEKVLEQVEKITKTMYKDF